MNFRIGHSKDVHQLAKGRKLILGGIEIEHELGLVGHSDADVLLHAIAESLIGAMALGDLGTLFPDTDDKYKDIDSQKILEQTRKILEDNNYEIKNIDATIYAEKPKLNNLMPKIHDNVARILNIEVTSINIKATRGEKMGYIGRQEGMGAECVALIYKK